MNKAPCQTPWGHRAVSIDPAFKSGLYFLRKWYHSLRRETEGCGSGPLPSGMLKSSNSDSTFLKTEREMNGLLNHSFTHLFINFTYIDFVSCARHLLNPEDTALSKQERALVCKEVTDSKKVHVKQETISF